MDIIEKLLSFPENENGVRVVDWQSNKEFLKLSPSRIYFLAKKRNIPIQIIGVRISDKKKKYEIIEEKLIERQTNGIVTINWEEEAGLWDAHPKYIVSIAKKIGLKVSILGIGIQDNIARLNAIRKEFIEMEQRMDEGKNFYINIERLGDLILRNKKVDTKFKLDEDKVHLIKWLLKHKALGQKEIADVFDLLPSSVSAIKKGRQWRHVKLEV